MTPSNSFALRGPFRSTIHKGCWTYELLDDGEIVCDVIGKTQQAALESISNRLALINQLINYSGDLGALLDVLRSRFTGTGGTNAQVTTLVNQINTDVNAINNFNNQATQAMVKFDSVTAKQ